jgi:DHA1 family tetracycline resistance protein-like MFS transporter
LTLAAVGVLNAIVQGVLVRPVVKTFGERRPLIAGLLCAALGMALFGAAPTGGWFLAALPVLALVGFVSPSSQALMTRHVGPSEQGQLQGANSSLMAVAGLIGPGVFSLTFAAFIRRPAWHLPGAPYFLAALVEFAAMVVAIRVTRDATP